MSKIIHPHIKQRIRELVELGYTAPDIRKILETQTPENLFDDLPSLRTIQRYYKQLSSQRSEDWDIRDCDDPEDAQIVFEALRLCPSIFFGSRMPTISKELADMVIRLKKADPLLDTGVLITLATLYLIPERKDDIYLLLVKKPYYPDPDFYFGYIRSLKKLYGDDWRSHAVFVLKKNCEKTVTVSGYWSFSFTHRIADSQTIDDKDTLSEEEAAALDRYYQNLKTKYPCPNFAPDFFGLPRRSL